MTETSPEVELQRSAVDWLLGRGRGPQTVLAFAIVALSLALGIFQFYSTYFGQAEGHTHRSTHLAFMLLLAYLLFPFGRKSFADPRSSGRSRAAASPT